MVYLQRRGRIAFMILCCGLTAALLTGCPKPSERAGAPTQPASGDESAAQAGLDDQKPASRPAPALEQSSYDSSPPYPVRLFVRRVEQEQPGWLRILKMSDPAEPATAAGAFPEQNRFLVDTRNVDEIRIHIRHLPTDPGKRIVLRIDNQPMEILRKQREYLILKRQSTGRWEVVSGEEN